MDEYGEVIEQGVVRFERLLPGPIERVWAYLVEPDKRAAWLAGGPMDGHEGGGVALHFFHADLTPHAEEIPARHRGCENGAEVRGRVVRWEPPRVLAFTWDETTSHPSEVTFSLAAEGDRVRLELTHRRLDARELMLDVASGWHAHLAVLSARLEGRVPPPFWEMHTAAEAAYGARLPAP